MNEKKLLPHAWVVLTLQALYCAAAALSTVFVSVYLWVNSHDLAVICRHYLVLFAVIPLFFILAGWYSQARDRVHVYRAGLVLHAVFYGALLLLREQSPHYAGWLGALLGVTWGIFWVGANTFNFDVTASGKREYFLGLMQVVSAGVSLVAPVLSGAIIMYSSDTVVGYHRVFALVLILFLACLVVSLWVPKDNVRRPFKIWRALFPGPDQRDWRLMMLVSASLTGSFTIFPILLGVLMYVQTANELTVGGYGTFQAVAALITAYFVGRTVSPFNRRRFMWWGVVILLGAGATVLVPLNVTTLFLFGLFRSVSGPMFGIPHSGLNLDIIEKSAEEPAQRIEYLCAWEVPLAIGRVIMMALLWLVYVQLGGGDFAARLMLFLLCAIRIVTYQLVIRTSPLRRPVLTAPVPAEQAAQTQQ
ncbi:MAG: MFS transporter [Candidatus Hydrogenedentes bacterium]|nr:MFS transporter [Candidatus Hydrogenedentota bacterium]